MEPIFNCNLGGEAVEMTRDNTSIFLHLGTAAVYDHIYHQREVGGTYIPNTASLYETIKEFMFENDYPIHANLRDVSDTDREVLERFWVRDLGKLASFPEAWERAGLEPDSQE